MCLNEIVNFVIHSAFIGGLAGILISAYLAYRFGIKAYRKQKSIEECRKKYVDEGLEALYDELATAYTAFRLNWQRAHQLLRLMRDWDSETFTFDKDKVENKFISYSPRNLALSCFHKVNELLGDDTLGKWSMAFFGELLMQNAIYFEQEFFINFERFLNTPNKNRKLCKEAYDRHYKKLSEIQQEIHKKLNLLDYLGKIISCVRHKQISYETMRKLKEDQEIKNLLDAVRAEFQKIQDDEQKSGVS
jgi:hypothetical protein